MEWKLSIGNLELKEWTDVVGLDINDPPADNYGIVQTSDSLNLIMCSSKPYSGWLAKHVESLPVFASSITFHYRMMIDECIACAQVVETDTKLTDDEGWTYDLSAQWNVANDWMFQVDNEHWTWEDSGVRIESPLPYHPADFKIEYLLDYNDKNSSIPAVWAFGSRYPLPHPPWIPAKHVGWANDEIVTQLQQCNNAQPGGYTLRFAEIGYVLSGLLP